MAIDPIQNGEGGLSVRNKINTSFQQLELKENISNKSQNVAADSTSTTKYPAVKAIVDWINGLFEKTANKSQNVAADSTSTTKYPAVKAIVDWVNGLFEKTSNKSQDVPGDYESTIKYPSTKAVNDFVTNRIDGLVEYNSYTPTSNFSGGVEELGVVDFCYSKVDGFYQIFGQIYVVTGDTMGYVSISFPNGITSGIVQGVASGINNNIHINSSGNIQIDIPAGFDGDLMLHCWGEL